MAIAGIDYRGSGVMAACLCAHDDHCGVLAPVARAAMCAVFLFSATRVDAIDASTTPNTSEATSYEQELSKEALGFVPSGAAAEQPADRPPSPTAQSETSSGALGQGRVDRIKAAVNQALAMPQPAQAPSEAQAQEKRQPDADAANARRQELKALIREPGKPASEPEARYLDQLRDEVSGTVVFKEAVAPEREAPPIGPRTVADGGSATYRVQRGDSLWKIAHAQLGDGYKWTRIYDANRAQLRNTDVLRIGQVLAIPDR